MVKITFPDGSVREYEQGVTGLQIAESISPALARDVVSCGINGETTELNRPKRASTPSGTLLPICSPRHCRSSTPAYSSALALLSRTASSMMSCPLRAR